MNRNTNENITDILVIGGGPVGMFTAFYAGMRQASVKLIESLPQLGGQLTALYPEKYIYDVAGFQKVRAHELIDSLVKQMNQFPVEVVLSEKVIQIRKKDERMFEITTDKAVHYSRSIIITVGAGAFQPRRLDLPEAASFERTNLHYYVDDLSIYKDQRVLISGGGDSAVDWAMMLEPIARDVTLIHRRDTFRAHEHSVERLRNSKVRVLTPKEIVRLHGDETIHAVTIKDVKSGELTEIGVDAVIINFGFVSSLGPITEWGIQIEGGSIVVDPVQMQTNIPGVFAAGDVSTYPGKLKLIAIGFSEAPRAVSNAKVYLDPTAKLSPGHSSSLKL